MNVLAPVLANGRLVPANAEPEEDGSLGGFSTGEYRVFRPNAQACHARPRRRRHGPLADARRGGRPRRRDAQRTVAQARLVVVHSQEIDTAGENGMGPALFDGVLQKLRAAWRLLREAGVRRFVFTADHGFLLLNDGTSRDAGVWAQDRPDAPPRLCHGRRRPPGRGARGAGRPRVRRHARATCCFPTARPSLIRASAASALFTAATACRSA